MSRTVAFDGASGSVSGKAWGRELMTTVVSVLRYRQDES